MIEVNGKELDEHGMRARPEARRRAGLYDDRTLALLERDIVEELEERVFSMIHVVYDLQRSLEDAGVRLEPPADLGAAARGGLGGRIGPFLRRLQTRFIRAVNEGYVQQQEKFNTFFTKAVDLSYRQLCGAGGGLEMEQAAGRRDAWLARRPEWGEEAWREIRESGRGAAVVVGIPGAGFLEAMREDGRLLIALDTDDAAVAEAQSRFLPAWFHPRPLEALERLGASGVGLAVVSFPECLSGDELDGLLGWAGFRLGEGGTVLLALNRERDRGMSGEDGFVRYWPRRFLEAALRKRGFACGDYRAGDLAFLKGEKKA
jgi:hypothetical protein